MFNYTIDQKRNITDPKGNVLVNLQDSIFSKTSEEINDYSVKRITKYFKMRPDLVATAVFGDQRYTEYILKFAGISNPFTICDDDVLLIPNIAQAEGMMAVNNPDESESVQDNVAAIRNFFKFVNTEYKSDSTAYDNLANTNIPSGVIDKNKAGDFIQPYITEDGRTSLTIKNNRIYFGGDQRQPIADESQISSDSAAATASALIKSVNSDYSDTNCLYNGTLMTDFVRASMNNNE